MPRPFPTTPQILGRGAQAAARDAATIPQQEKITSAELSAEQIKFCRLHLYSGKVALAAMYLRRV
jgi:spermidine synthase